MKKSFLIAAVSLMTAVSAQATVVLEYDIAGLPSGVASLAPSVNTVGGGNLTYTGDASNILPFDKAIYAQNWASTASMGANGFSFTAADDLPLNGATLTFGASSTDPWGVTLYVNNTSMGTQNFTGGGGSNDLVTYDLTSLNEQSGPVNFKIVFTGGSASQQLGLDTTIAGDAAKNVKLNVPTTPVPEPHEYAMIAGACLIGFAVYRRRQMGQAESQI